MTANKMEERRERRRTNTIIDNVWRRDVYYCVTVMANGGPYCAM
jgi:hypothetical protein